MNEEAELIYGHVMSHCARLFVRSALLVQTGTANLRLPYVWVLGVPEHRGAPEVEKSDSLMTCSHQISGLTKSRVHVLPRHPEMLPQHRRRLLQRLPNLKASGCVKVSERHKCPAKLLLYLPL